MSKIEVGEFIKKRNGKIAKIKNKAYIKLYKSNKYIVDVPIGIVDTYNIWEEEIVKHSKDIIDLIEVGDYVNGSMVYEILEDGRIHIMTGHLLNNKDIKTILTHEQFTQNAYELEE